MRITDQAGNAYDVSIEVITPTMAAKYLDNRLPNRRESNVPKYAADMAQNRWRLTGQPIIFGATGELLLDGNNRLGGCKLSGVPFETFVVRGIAKNAHVNVDTGKSRTLKDALKFLPASKQVDYENTVTYMLKRIVQIEEGRPVASGTFTTREEELAALTNHPEVESIAGLVQHFDYGKELLGFLSWLYSREWGYKGKVAEFLEAYQPKDGDARVSPNHPAQVLNKLFSGKRKLSKAERLSFAMSAFNSYILDRKLPTTPEGKRYLKPLRVLEVGDTGTVISTDGATHKTKAAAAGK